MKHLVKIIVISFTLVACQSTAPSKKVKVPNKEQQIEKGVTFLKSQISQGKQEKRLDLAVIYSASFDPATRMLAKPVLEQLVEEDNIDAIILFSQLEYLGRLGYVSDARLIEHYQRILEKKPDTIDDYKVEKAEMTKALQQKFTEFKRLYDENHQLCEQPLSPSITALEEKPNTYLVVKYFEQCLARYSVKNAEQRLKVMAKIQALVCSTKPSDKVCVSEGYEALSAGLEGLQPSFVNAAAIRNVYKSHKTSLRSEWGNRGQYLTPPTFKVMDKSLRAFNDKDVNGSLEMLFEYKASRPDMNAYDLAYMENFMAYTLYSRGEEGDLALAIEHAKRTLASDQLEYKSHWKLFDFLANLYIVNEQYGNYIELIGNYIVDNQGSLELIPVNRGALSNASASSASVY